VKKKNLGKGRIALRGILQNLKKRGPGESQPWDIGRKGNDFRSIQELGEKEKEEGGGGGGGAHDAFEAKEQGKA